MLKRGMSSLLVLAMIFAVMLSMPMIQASAASVVATDSTVVCADTPAGMGTVVEDLGNGFVSLKLKLKGQMKINSFSWAVGYDKTKVVPVTVSDKTDAPNSELSTAAQIAPYYEIPGSSLLTGWPISSYEIENTTAVAGGNYLLIGFARYTGSVGTYGTSITLANNEEVTILKLTFRKIGTDASTAFTNYYNNVGATAVSKLIYLTTNIVQQGQAVPGTVVRPDLFYSEFIPYSPPTPTATATAAPTATPAYSVTLTCLNAADETFTGDTALDPIMNDGGATTFSVRATYSALETLQSVRIDYVTKSATISGLVPGSYLFTVSRAGYLIREFTVNVTQNTDLGDMSLIAGDLDGNGGIDFVDSAMVAESYGYYIGNEMYNPAFDLNLDGGIDFVDVGIVSDNYGLYSTQYGDYIDYN